MRILHTHIGVGDVALIEILAEDYPSVIIQPSYKTEKSMLTAQACKYKDREIQLSQQLPLLLG